MKILNGRADSRDQIIYHCSKFLCSCRKESNILNKPISFHRSTPPTQLPFMYSLLQKYIYLPVSKVYSPAMNKYSTSAFTPNNPGILLYVPLFFYFSLQWTIKLTLFQIMQVSKLLGSSPVNNLFALGIGNRITKPLGSNSLGCRQHYRIITKVICC